MDSLSSCIREYLHVKEVLMENDREDGKSVEMSNMQKILSKYSKNE